MPRHRRKASPGQTARLLARRTRGKARGARLLGARGQGSMARLGDVRGGDADVRRAVLLFHQGYAPVLGRAAGQRAGCRARLWTRNRRLAACAARAVSRPVRDNANPLVTRAITQPVDERGGGVVRGASAARDHERRLTASKRAQWLGEPLRLSWEVMPIVHRVDHENRIVLARAYGVLTDEDVFTFQHTVWSQPEVA